MLRKIIVLVSTYFYCHAPTVCLWQCIGLEDPILLSKYTPHIIKTSNANYGEMAWQQLFVI